MSWIIIIGVFILAAGPLFYLMPTAKDKRLTALRSNALQMGFTIQLDSLLKLDPSADERVTAGAQARSTKIECLRYQLPIGQTLNHIPPLTLQRIPSQPTIQVTELMNGWGLPEETSKRADSGARSAVSNATSTAAWQRQGQLLETMRALLLEMPEDVLGIAIDGRCVGVFWLERSGKQNVDKAAAKAFVEPLSIIHTSMCKIIEKIKTHPWETD